MISKVARSFEGYKEASKHWWLWACRGACTHVQAVIFDVLIDKQLKVEPEKVLTLCAFLLLQVDRRGRNRLFLWVTGF